MSFNRASLSQVTSFGPAVVTWHVRGVLCEEPRRGRGPLMGGPQCGMSILRNGNVACLCRLFSPMSHVEFKK